MFLVGLTGGIASGKSAVSKIFQENGIPVIDADKISREVRPGTSCYAKLRKAFGPEYFLDDGELDRKLLGQLIFADEPKRKILNRIVHPAIRWEMGRQIFFCLLSGHQFVILDLPLLFESKIYTKIVQKIIVVYCTQKTQIQRLSARDQLGTEDCLMRINAQLPLESKKKLATYLINNDGLFEETKTQTLQILTDLRRSKLHIIIRFALFAFPVFLTCIAYKFCKLL